MSGRHHSRAMLRCAGHNQDTQDDLAAPVGGVKTSATGLLEPTIFERLWLVSPASRGFFSFSIKPFSLNLRGVQFRVVADEILFSNAWACFRNVDAIFHSVHPYRS